MKSSFTFYNLFNTDLAAVVHLAQATCNSLQWLFRKPEHFYIFTLFDCTSVGFAHVSAYSVFWNEVDQMMEIKWWPVFVCFVCFCFVCFVLFVSGFLFFFFLFIMSLGLVRYFLKQTIQSSLNFCVVWRTSRSSTRSNTRSCTLVREITNMNIG